MGYKWCQSIYEVKKRRVSKFCPEAPEKIGDSTRAIQQSGSKNVFTGSILIKYNFSV